MIRYINCVRKRQDITLEEFRSYWNSPEFKALVKKLAQYYQAERYSLNLTLRVEIGEILVSKNGLSEPYDATLEMFWPSANKLDGLYNNETAQALGEEFQAFESDFIDITRSTAFFTLEDDHD